MILACLSDPHLLWENPIARLDNTPKTALNKFEYVLKYCAIHNMSLLIAGDFFDKPRSWYFLPVITKMLRKYEVYIMVVYGQHDTYLYSEETREATILGELEAANLVKVLGENIYEPFKTVDIYGCSFGGTIPKVKDKNRKNILVIHAPISTKLDYGVKYDAKKFLKESEFDFILCGDIHRKFIYKNNKRYIVNTGSLIRKEANEYNFIHKPCFFCYDTDSNEIEERIIPHELADKVLTREHIEEKEDKEVLKEFSDKLKSTKTKGNLIEVLWDIVKCNNVEKEVVDALSSIVNKDK